MLTLQGAMTAMVTPFGGGEVDYDRLRQNVDAQIAKGVDGLVPCGTTGESPTLSHDEHDKVIEAVVEQANGRVPVIAGTGSNSLTEALRLTEHAQSVGADACLSVCPYYNKPSQEGIYRHFMTIADSVALPIVLYNIPGRTGVTMQPALIARLAQHPHIVAVKEATESLDIASAIAATCDITIISGSDSLTLPLMSIGGKGVISVMTNVAPEPFVKMTHAALEGDWPTARRIHNEQFDLIDVFMLAGNPATVKTAMAMCGMDTGELRVPLVEIDDASKSKLKTVLEKYGLC